MASGAFKGRVLGEKALVHALKKAPKEALAAINNALQTQAVTLLNQARGAAPQAADPGFRPSGRIIQGQPRDSIVRWFVGFDYEWAAQIETGAWLAPREVKRDARGKAISGLFKVTRKRFWFRKVLRRNRKAVIAIIRSMVQSKF